MRIVPCLTRSDWERSLCIVAGTGPSLTREVADECMASGRKIIAVNNAYHLLPRADVLYACDEEWWIHYGGASDFHGEKWTSFDNGRNSKDPSLVEKYNLNVVHGRHETGFSFSRDHINYGRNSGFQAVNLAILWGSTTVVLVGFDMNFGYGVHFFGDYPANSKLRRSTDHSQFIRHFDYAAKHLPADIRILNATPNSALKCFPEVKLSDALR